MASEMNEQLDRIERMLRAQLKGEGHLWWISGFVYGQTSRDDLFIILYPADERLVEKVVRVYPHDFKKLPTFIRTEGIDGGDTDGNPNKEQARRKGIYHECPLFEIVTFDGKDTQMGKERRFGDVVRVTNAERRAPSTERGIMNDERQVTNGKQAPTPASPAQPPPPPPPAADVERPELPDYRAMAVGAKTAGEFDYAAYMVLRNGLYTEVERITRTRESLVPAWQPGERPNGAMLSALAVYRDKRSAAEGRGEAAGAAHKFARREAMSAYNKAIR
jgi:hypothetical protein